LNGSLERAQRTHTEEFYQVTACALEITGLTALIAVVMIVTRGGAVW